MRRITNPSQSHPRFGGELAKDRKMTEIQFVLFSLHSLNGCLFHPSVTFLSKEEIVARAEDESTKEGDSLESLAGIRWVEDEEDEGRWERELQGDELLSVAIEKLSDDGRLFRCFDLTKEGADDFLESCRNVVARPHEGLNEAAEDLVQWCMKHLYRNHRVA